MAVLVKFIAIVAALSVLWVLVTPAPDELPCTGHKSPAFLAAVATASSVALLPLHSSETLAAAPARSHTRADVLSITCAFLC